MTPVDQAIEPYLGIGNIQLGMSRATIRAVLGNHTSFKKTASAKMETDAFDDAGVHVYYDDSDCAEAFEMFLPAHPTLHGRSLLGNPYGTVRAWASTLDPQLTDNDAGFDSKALGISVYAPDATVAPDEPVESVLIFRKGYLDDR
jgi:hypothetical protein